MMMILGTLMTFGLVLLFSVFVRARTNRIHKEFAEKAAAASSRQTAVNYIDLRGRSKDDYE